MASIRQRGDTWQTWVSRKDALSESPLRDPLKRLKDALQARIVWHLWDKYLTHRQPGA